ncbi:MAG: hypothetical protein RIE32_13860 [Phycisphaerales bacterium]
MEFQVPDQPVHSNVLQAQLAAACDAMRTWDGTIEMPSNPSLCLRRDDANVIVLQRNRELAKEVSGRIMDYHLRNYLVNASVDTYRRAMWPWVFGICDSTFPRDPSAMLLRELAARFVEAGVAACA